MLLVPGFRPNDDEGTLRLRKHLGWTLDLDGSYSRLTRCVKHTQIHPNHGTRASATASDENRFR